MLRAASWGLNEMFEKMMKQKQKQEEKSNDCYIPIVDTVGGRKKYPEGILEITRCH